MGKPKKQSNPSVNDDESFNEKLNSKYLKNSNKEKKEAEKKYQKFLNRKVKLFMIYSLE
jgi:ribosomal protein S4